MTMPGRFDPSGGTGDGRVAELIAMLRSVLAGGGTVMADGVAPRDWDTGVAVGDASAVARRLRYAFPDVVWTIDDVTCEDDVVLCHASASGTHEKPYAGFPPTSRRLTMQAVFVAHRAAVATADGTAAWWCALDHAPLGSAES